MLGMVSIGCNGGKIVKSALAMPAGSHALVDHAYFWPMFHPITEAVQYGPEDIAVFTLSKLTGVHKAQHMLTAMLV